MTSADRLKTIRTALPARSFHLLSRTVAEHFRVNDNESKYFEEGERYVS